MSNDAVKDETGIRGFFKRLKEFFGVDVKPADIGEIPSDEQAALKRGLADAEAVVAQCGIWQSGMKEGRYKKRLARNAGLSTPLSQGDRHNKQLAHEVDDERG